MRVDPRTAERLLAVTRQVGVALDRLLAYLEAADQLLRSGSGRIGPALVGGIDSASDALHAADRERAGVAAKVALTHGAEAATLADLADDDTPWGGDARSLRVRLDRKLTEIDHVTARLRQHSGRRLAVAGSRSEVTHARTLVRDALHQSLDELVPDELRSWLAAN
ncbi:MAG: hypothetical protein R3343_00490 [Nitriliruptorales bacterium]|nr:hypothetical protein [Nitriliruptorales bacterium]